MKKKILVIDNYDSFVYNLVHHIKQLVGHEIDVFRNNAITIEQAADYDYIFISPGPGIPEESGITVDLIKHYYKTKNILGVCLGLQAIIVALGGRIVNLNKVYHGIEDTMYVEGNPSTLFHGMNTSFQAGRYHSWAADEKQIPDSLDIICRDDEGKIMAIQHKHYNLYGVQFHPESIMTPLGIKIISNFLNLPAA